MDKNYSRKDLLHTGLWFFLFNSILAIAISVRDFRYISDINGFLPILYLILTEITHIVSLAFLAYLILYIPLILLLKNRIAAQISAISISVVGLMVLLIDSLVFDLYRFHINGSVLAMVFGSSPGNVIQINFSQYVLFIVIVGALLLFERFMFRLSFKLVLKNRLGFGKFILIPLLVFWVFVNGVHAWATAANYQPVTQLSKYYPAFIQFENSGLFYRLGWVDNKDIPQDKLHLAMSDRLDYPKHRLRFVSDLKRKNPNILFILIDGWNYRTLDSTVMPSICRFSKQAATFNHHYSGSNGTQYGITSLFYGLPGIYWNSLLSSHTPPVLVKELVKRQYEFFVRTSATIKNPPFDQTVFYPVQSQLKDMPGKESYDRDVQIMQEWLRFSNSRSQQKDNKPFFGFLFFDDLHAICQPPFFKKKFPTEWDYAKYERLSNDMDPTDFFNLYKNIAGFEDVLVDKILNDLKEKGLLDNTIVIITADHGQEFNENKKNYWGHNSNFAKYQMQVPFILYYPKVKPKTYTHWTSHYDVVPTLLTKFLGCKNSPEDYCTGKSLFDDKKERDYLFVANVNNNGTLGIIDKTHIINILPDDDYDILDQNLNPVSNARLNIGECNYIIDKNKAFFR
ncbi:MAG: DUF3413 domain-containing protein [Paludibacteraceae bacterium]|nr:DUF3413 domain-containing protein [Paludibacteraceae bacterium]